MLRLKTMTFNMQNGQVWDPRHPDDAPIDIQASIDFIRGQDCDIYFLQEVEFPYQELPDHTVHPNFDRISAGLSGYFGSFAYPAATRPHHGQSTPVAFRSTQHV